MLSDDQLQRINRASQVRIIAKAIAQTYHRRECSFDYIFGEATGGQIFVECAEVALSTIEDLNT